MQTKREHNQLVKGDVSTVEHLTIDIDITGGPITKHKECHKIEMTFSILVSHQQINQELSFSQTERNVEEPAQVSKLNLNRKNLPKKGGKKKRKHVCYCT